jgi:hypothetical protein
MHSRPKQELALTRFIAWVLLIDDVGTALAAHNLAIGITFFQRFERVSDFHNQVPVFLSQLQKSQSACHQRIRKVAAN